jgi:hypothetical protein
MNQDRTNHTEWSCQQSNLKNIFTYNMYVYFSFNPMTTL